MRRAEHATLIEKVGEYFLSYVGLFQAHLSAPGGASMEYFPRRISVLVSRCHNNDIQFPSQ